MDSASKSARLLAGLVSAVLVSVVSGCQSGGSGLLDLGLGSKKQDAAPQETITADALRAYCPRVQLRSGTSFYNSYEKGGENDPSRVVYQASITDVTRSCNYVDGTLVMTVAAAGKVVPGPKAKDGPVNVPIRVAVVRGAEVLYSEVRQQPVSIAASAPAAQFVFSNPEVVFPAPTERNIQVFVGYDDGPSAPQRRN